MDTHASTAPLLANLDSFTGFVRRRTGDTELAAEVVQEALSKALTRREALRDGEALLPWFWRILRNTLNDTLARRGRTMQLPDSLVSATTEERHAICACLAEALTALPKRQQEAIRRIDLGGEDPDAAAADLGIGVGNLKVIRHRARTALLERLRTICRTCAVHGCLDCHCREPAPRTS